MTAYKVAKREGITGEGMETSADLGDYLLSVGRIAPKEYEIKRAEALRTLEDAERSFRRKG